jgi:hypothetical protein
LDDGFDHINKGNFMLSRKYQQIISDKTQNSNNSLLDYNYNNKFVDTKVFLIKNIENRQKEKRRFTIQKSLFNKIKQKNKENEPEIIINSTKKHKKRNSVITVANSKYKNFQDMNRFSVLVMSPIHVPRQSLPILNKNGENIIIEKKTNNIPIRKPSSNISSKDSSTQIVNEKINIPKLEFNFNLNKSKTTSYNVHKTIGATKSTSSYINFKSLNSLKTMRTINNNGKSTQSTINPISNLKSSYSKSTIDIKSPRKEYSTLKSLRSESVILSNRFGHI